MSPLNHSEEALTDFITVIFVMWRQWKRSALALVTTVHSLCDSSFWRCAYLGAEAQASRGPDLQAIFSFYGGVAGCRLDVTLRIGSSLYLHMYMSPLSPLLNPTHNE